jgi:AraC-like DNA-binding protein
LQHVEFFNTDHFEYRYLRKKAKKSLSGFIDFFWETDFEQLWSQFPNGFSDALFPNIGYTYLINLGTPFIMQLEEKKYPIKSDAFLPRHKCMICHHSKNNKIFGIKFKVSPIVFEKKVNFFEYREFIYPLAYLIDRKVIKQIKDAASFKDRVDIISAYYDDIVNRHHGSLKHVDIVTEALKEFERSNFKKSIEEISNESEISTRTMQRYFEATVSINSKTAFQIMRIRKAVEQLLSDASDFDLGAYGYYDYSHFYKHLKSFLDHKAIEIVQPHLQVLKKINH